jgi:low temperature requirement protein LtrA
MRIAGSRAPGAERVVTPLELFFDLVYLFAIGQLSHHLLEHVELRTGAETAIMALAVVRVWELSKQVAAGTLEAALDSPPWRGPILGAWRSLMS